MPPVFIDAIGSTASFLDDVFGRRIANDLRSLFGDRPPEAQPIIHQGGFRDVGSITSCGPNSYFEAALSSFWALLVVLIALAAGLCWPSRKKLSLWLLGAGLTVSSLDTAIRFFPRYDAYPAEMQDLLAGALPSQLLANGAFQFAVPFAAGLCMILIVNRLRWTFGKVSRQR